MPSVDLAEILRSRGVDSLDAARYVEITGEENLPGGFRARGNRVFVPKRAEATLPRITEHKNYAPTRNTVLILNGKADYTIKLWGEDGFLCMAPDVKLRRSSILLGGGSIVLGEQVRASSHLHLAARNGGRILLKRDVMISVEVEILTDDAHTLMDASTRRRLNHYGGVIEIGEHVWIGRRAMIMGNTSIGDHSVVGACALVRNKRTEANVVLAGVPARVVRTGVTWTPEDLPPG